MSLSAVSYTPTHDASITSEYGVQANYHGWKDMISKFDDNESVVDEIKDVVPQIPDETKDVMDETKVLALENNSLLHAQSVTLQYIQLSNGQIPDLMDQLEEVEFPYMFNLLTADEFKTFKSTLMPEQSLRKRARGAVKETEEAIGRARELFECCRDFLDSLKNKETATAFRKSWRLFSGRKTEVVYLQLLCGLTLLPVVSYKIETKTIRSK